jgi:hypothetical protein
MTSFMRFRKEVRLIVLVSCPLTGTNNELHQQNNRLKDQHRSILCGGRSNPRFFSLIMIEF